MKRTRFLAVQRSALAASSGLLSLASCQEWPATAAASASQSGSAEAALHADAGAPDGTSHEAPLTPRWQRALETPDGGVSTGSVAGHGGRVFVAGSTRSTAQGDASGEPDAFVAAYAATGAPLWTRQLGTPEHDAASGVSADEAGGAFVAGTTAGAIAGPQRGYGDAFVVRYSAAGALEWTAQLGTAAPDSAASVSADASHVFVAGATRGGLESEREGADLDAFVAAYTITGKLIFVRQLGSAAGYDDSAAAVSTSPGGGAVLVGNTFGNLEGESQGSSDAFAAKYSPEGEPIWTRQLGGSGYDTAAAVSVDPSGNVYVGGEVGGSRVGGPGVVVGSTPFLAKYSPSGALLWQQRLEDASMGALTGISAADGEILVAGYTSSSLGGPNRGAYDAFVASYAADGSRRWAIQPGLAGSDRATGVSAEEDGTVFFAQHAMGGGLGEAFLTRLR